MNAHAHLGKGAGEGDDGVDAQIEEEDKLCPGAER